jgi:hypothetical protein
MAPTSCASLQEGERKDFTTNLRNRRNPDKNFEQKLAKIAKKN